MMAAMRSPAWPSQSGGPSAGPASSPRSAASTIGPSASGSTSRLVPWVMVTGRSVFGRSVRHGMRSTVVSSWMPPLSVTTSAAPRTRDRNSR